MKAAKKVKPEVVVWNTNNKPVVFKRKYGFDEFIDFVKTQTQKENFFNLVSDKQLENLKKQLKSRKQQLGVMHCHSNSKAYRNWLALSDLRRKSEVKFYYKQIDASEQEYLKVYYSYKEPKELREDLTIKNINNFLKISQLPDVMQLTFDSLEKVDKMIGQPMLVAVLNKGNKTQMQALVELKQEVKHKLIVSYLYENNKALLKDLATDTQRVYKGGEMFIQVSGDEFYQIYPMTNNIDYENMLYQYKLFNEGQLARLPNSQPVPTDNHLKANKIAVYNNFQTLTNGPKMTLLLIYLPSCKHCQKILPIFQQLAIDIQQIDREQRIQCAQIDYSMNAPVLKQNVRLFPTVVGLDGKGGEVLFKIKQVSLLNIVKVISQDSKWVFAFNWSLLEAKYSQQHIQQDINQDIKQEL